MDDAVESLGLVSMTLYCLSMLTYLVKRVSVATGVYQAIKLGAVGHHRLLGLSAAGAVGVHATTAVFSEPSAACIVTGAMMVWTCGLGAYGAYVRKGRRGRWLGVHRVTAFLVLPTIGLHIA